MFYCYDWLCLRKRGRYSIIWFAAHHGRSPSRLDFTKVDIGATCEELMETVMLPTNAKHTAKRLSLCLASKLMHGACVVYREQTVFLLRDVMSFLEKCFMSGAMKLTAAMKQLEKNDNDAAEPLRKRIRITKKKKDLLAEQDPNVLVLEEISIVHPVNEETVVLNLQKTRDKYPHKYKQLFLEPPLNEARDLALEQIQESSHPQFFERTDPLILEEIVLNQRPTNPEIPILLEPCQPPINDKEMLTEALQQHILLRDDQTQALAPQITVTEDQEMTNALEVHTAIMENQAPTKTQIKDIQLEEPPPKRALSPNTISTEKIPRKKPCAFGRNIFYEDTVLTWSVGDLRKFKHVSRAQEIVDDFSSVEPQQEDFLLYAAKFKFLRVQQEYIRKKRMSVRHEESSAQEKLYGSSISHLSHLSVDQADELKKIQEPLQVIPEQADISRDSVIQPETGDGLQINIVPEYIQPSEVILAPISESQELMDINQAEPSIAVIGEDVQPPPKDVLTVIQEQEIQSGEENRHVCEKSTVSMSPRTKSEATRENLLEKLQDQLTQQNGQITFTDLCPPGKIRRIIAAQIFNILLHLQKGGVVSLKQKEPYKAIFIKKIY